MSPVQGARSVADDFALIVAGEPAALVDPFSVVNRLREELPVHRYGPAVYISRYEDCKAMFRDSRFSARGWIDGSRSDAALANLTTDEQRQAFHEVREFESLYMSRTDGEQHDRLRRIAHRAFTPRRVAEMRATIQRCTDDLIAQLEAHETPDFVDFGYRLPLMVICEMLGVPPEDREKIHNWSARIGSNRGGADPVALMAVHSALREYRAYVAEVIAAHRAEGGGSDLVGALLEAHEGEALTDDELAAMFVLLLFAGHETTSNLLSIGLLELLRSGDQWNLLCEDVTRAPGAVEELLRFASPVQSQPRVTIDDVEMRGVLIERGTYVEAQLAAANRDPDVFADPDRLDIFRTNSKQHLTFGFGAHFCLGASLARLEGEIAFTTLATRFPDIELASDKFAFTGPAQLRKLLELPVRLGAPRAT